MHGGPRLRIIGQYRDDISCALRVSHDRGERSRGDERSCGTELL